MRAAAPRHSPTQLQRPEALRLLDQAFPDQPIILTIGGTIREMVAFCGRRSNHLPMLDSMGLATPIGLGLAVGLADEPAIERVVVADGDGSLLMGFSVLSSIGLLRPKKLVVVVCDNGVYLATGGQATAAVTTDFVAVARACGLRSALVEGAEALEAGLQRARTEDGPWLLRVPVGTEAPPTPFFNADPVVLRADFGRWLAARRA
ncbi:MAG TPA: thiamine pyrophosphate-dependent enzyme [Chloroflexota bacterium]|nr:thiamine pyrophosphate-dependent enzyme [Chloroflexota bacterium]